MGDRIMRRVWTSPWTMLALFAVCQAGAAVVWHHNMLAWWAYVATSGWFLLCFVDRGRERWGYRS